MTTLDKAKKEATHRWPQVLPGGKAVIFTSHTQATADFDNATIEVLTLATGERKVLQKGGSYGRYVPSGHLVYVSKAALFAVPFDLSRLEVTGSPAPVVQDVFWNPTEGAAQFTFSSTGVLTYLRGGPEVAKYTIASVDRRGGTTKLIEEAGAYANPRLSPDGKRLSLTVLKDGNFDIWVYDLERGVPTRLTFDDAPETEQVWSPDGRFLAFSSGRAGADNLYRKRADGSGEEERLTTSDNPMWPNSWSSDGRSIAIAAMGPNGNFDVTMLSLADKKVEPLLNSNFREADPHDLARWPLAGVQLERIRAPRGLRAPVSVRRRPMAGLRQRRGLPAVVRQRARAVLPGGRWVDGGVDRRGRRQHPHRQADAALHGRLPRGRDRRRDRRQHVCGLRRVGRRPALRDVPGVGRRVHQPRHRHAGDAVVRRADADVRDGALNLTASSPRLES